MKQSIFLRAKHWQIFVALILLAFFAMVVMGIFMATAISSIQGQFLHGSQPAVSPETFSWIFYVMPFVIILASSPQLLWMWSVVNKLRAFINQGYRLPRLMLFRACFVVFVLIIAYLPIHFFNFFEEAFGAGDTISPIRFIGFALGVFFIQMVMLFCFLNMTFSVAKTIKMAEEQRDVKFGDFIGDFFFILFVFPVAIWFIQPRINAVLLKESNEGSPLSNGDVLDL